MARFATCSDYARVPGLIRAAWLAGVLALAACTSTLPPGNPPAQVSGLPPGSMAGPIQSQPLPDAMAGMAGMPGPAGPVDDGRVRVALLVPMTGSASSVGLAMVDAAQMALFDVGDDRFKLLPRDTKGTPQGAAEAARSVLGDGARLILGPLFGGSVAGVKPEAQAAGVSVVAFSNDWTQGGNGAWVMGFVPADQVTRVVGYARAQGITRFAALAPRSAYGDAVVNALQNAAMKGGGDVTWIERYAPDASDLSTPVRNLAAHAGFQALLVAEGGDRLHALAPLLAANGLDSRKVRLLGTGLWDDPSLSRESALAGGWFAAPAPEARAEFESKFQALYNRKPPRLATLAYDATALAAVLARTGGPQPFDPAALTNPSGFVGVDGIFRLRPEGLVERGLAVIEVTPEGFRAIDPAPRSFETLTQ